MTRTPASLLERLRSPHDAEAWARFVELYTPLLFVWTRRLGERDEDAADLVQDVYTLLLRKLPVFRYDGGRRFRGWLWTVVRNTWATARRRTAPVTAPLPDVADPADDLGEVEEGEARRVLVGRALELMRAEFADTTWRAFWETAVNERPAAEVGAELGLSAAAVYAARSRVLRRLREDL